MLDKIIGAVLIILAILIFIGVVIEEITNIWGNKR